MGSLVGQTLGVLGVVGEDSTTQGVRLEQFKELANTLYEVKRPIQLLYFLEVAGQ